MRFLLTFFIIMPILEMWMLIRVGSAIGALSTIALVLATAVAGAYLVRREGIRTLTAIQEQLRHNRLPGVELLDGAMLLLSGALLMTPGFFTDGIGFLLVSQTTRVPIRRVLMSYFQTAFVNRRNFSSDAGSDAIVIEGRCRRESEDQDPARL